MNTGFTYLDGLSPKQRTEVFRKEKHHWNSLTVEERTQCLSDCYELIREKMKSKNGLITQEQAVKEIINVDFPVALQEAIEEADRNHDLQLAQELRKRHFGIDTFAIKLNQVK
jgi:hypothetical protein